ncbi:MAG: hypothetical protein KBC69_00830 [Candidatus Magasanikbacteria bacterium]|nr:hypothetical protein [Candidatus Magasanikbacteria bacterium]
MFGISFVHWLVVVSAVISISGSVSYIKDTLKGKTKPNRISWSLWAFASLVGAFAAFSAQADLWATSRIFIAGFIPLIVFIVSFVNKNSYWKLTLFDSLCGVCSIIALIIWLVIDSPALAILFAALGDGLATLPTIVKAWKYPETESGYLFIASLISVLLVLPSIPKWDIVNSAFQVYLLIANVALIFSIYRKRLGFVRVS